MSRRCCCGKPHEKRVRRWLTGVLFLALPIISSAQVSVLQVKIVEGEGTVHLAGARIPHPLTVEVTDETGRPAAGAAVSFLLPDEGPSGHFSNGLRTDIVTADSKGRASVRGIQLNRIPGQFQIRITASKEQARAGTVSFQYIAEPKGGAPAVGAASPSRKKWVVLAAILVGAAAGGVAAGVSGGSRGVTPSAAIIPSAAPVPTPLTIGTPAITVGRP